MAKTRVSNPMPRGGWSLSALPPKADTLTGGHQCLLSATSRHSGLCREVENRKAAAYLRLAQAEFYSEFLDPSKGDAPRPHCVFREDRGKGFDLYG